MAEQHRATSEHWDLIGRMCHHGGHPEFSAIIELLHRVEALEAVQHAKPNHPAKPDSSLKGRIKSRMIDNIGSTWEEISASVLVEVAAWLREQKSYGHGWAAITLEQEAER